MTAAAVDAGQAPALDVLRQRTRAWVGEHLVPNADAWEAAGGFPREVFAAAGAEGVFGHKAEPALGGTGPDLPADAVVTEELSACRSGGVAAALGAHKDLGPYYVSRFGTTAQRQRWVPGCVRGELVGALAVTEPGAGSDVAGLRTAATPQPGGDWLLDGVKTFITNGSWADVIVTAALTDPAAGAHHGTSLFVVQAGDQGLSRRRIPTLGWRTSHTAELTFTGLRLPADRLLGGDEALGKGFAMVMQQFQWERIGMALGAVRSAEDLLRHAIESGADALRLADRTAEVMATRSLVAHALDLVLTHGDAVREVSMAKWSACALAATVADDVLRALGPAALHAGWVERAVRDDRLGPIGGGTTEVMLELIARMTPA